ncbi:uncharacterized protein SPSK_08028 [Sporothrix schenckii 1099-18]|uniref:Uncharacterized protein n=1 Tax=Sporothrix schenckii 1099-18 TaxID=1397361 RepID=A0A0F2MJJ9_SPOSC|nr:uncharacterized protein SPSK_08028 [Sporothrix schenckii 1099-18]KJR88361.1 hypothetical protein SPSK_08028 [Sporothrix schenckii 1099-18]
MRIVQEVSVDEDAAFVDNGERAGNSTGKRAKSPFHLAWYRAEGWRLQLRMSGDIVESCRWTWRVDDQLLMRAGEEAGETGGERGDRRHSTISHASASSHENNSDGQDGSGKSGHIKTATATSKTSLASARTGRSLGGFGFRPNGEQSTSKEQITTIDERRPSRATTAALQEHDE